MAQLAIAWVLAQGEDVVPLVGARRRERLHEALGALDLDLSAADRERIEAAVPAGAAAGDRYAGRPDGHARQRAAGLTAGDALRGPRAAGL